MDETGIDARSGKELVKINPKYYRPTEVDSLLGDSTKAQNKLGWKAKTTFRELVRIMVKADWEKVKRKGY